MTFLSCTNLQDNTIDNLHSKLDNLYLTRDAQDSFDIFFCGESEDGPSAGTITRDGNIDWLVGKVNL